MNRLTRGLWSLYAKSYDGLLSFWPYQNLLNLMQNQLPVSAADRVLDLGCGTGNLMAACFKRQPQASYTGLDVSPGMLSVARRKLAGGLASGHIELVQDELMAYLQTCPDASFTMVASMNVIYTVADQTALWQELIRVTDPEGRIVVTTSIRPGSGPIIREHFEHAGVLPLLRPRLLAVFIIDAIINLLGHTGHFAFADEAKLQAAVHAAGGIITHREVCYGGSRDGVNVLLTVTR